MIKSFEKAQNDLEILQMAEEGLKDYTIQLNELQ